MPLWTLHLLPNIQYNFWYFFVGLLVVRVVNSRCWIIRLLLLFSAEICLGERVESVHIAVSFELWLSTYLDYLVVHDQDLLVCSDGLQHIELCNQCTGVQGSSVFNAPIYFCTNFPRTCKWWLGNLTFYATVINTFYICTPCNCSWFNMCWLLLKCNCLKRVAVWYVTAAGSGLFSNFIVVATNYSTALYRNHSAADIVLVDVQLFISVRARAGDFLLNKYGWHSAQ